LSREEKKMIGVIFRVLGAVGAGAAVMYFLDSERGAERRMALKDKASKLGADLSETVQKGVTDLSNRSKVVMDDVRKMIPAGQPGEPGTAGDTFTSSPTDASDAPAKQM
jgi:CO dehydrogenase/acetyl-CoA synthase alpha subunit